MQDLIGSVMSRQCIVLRTSSEFTRWNFHRCQTRSCGLHMKANESFPTPISDVQWKDVRYRQGSGMRWTRLSWDLESDADFASNPVIPDGTVRTFLLLSIACFLLLGTTNGARVPISHLFHMKELECHDENDLHQPPPRHDQPLHKKDDGIASRRHRTVGEMIRQCHR
ncbi:hypothetical protein AHAS_Ahas11G0083200 [Arachis hypogaea]